MTSSMIEISTGVLPAVRGAGPVDQIRDALVKQRRQA